MAASRNVTDTGVNQLAGTKTTTTAPSTTTTSTTGGSSSNAIEVSSQQNLTPQALAQLNALIQTLIGGGTPEQRAEKAKRDQTTLLVEQLLGQVSTGQAIEDSKALMALNLQQALEENMPAIARAVEGAGLNTSTLQGVLSGKLARDSSLAAGALGAKQAEAYAAQRSNLANTLEALTRPTNNTTNALLKALDVAKGAVVNTQRDAASSSSSFSNQVVNNPGSFSTSTFTPQVTTPSLGIGGQFTFSPVDPYDFISAASQGSSTGDSFSSAGSYWDPQQTTLAEWLQSPVY